MLRIACLSQKGGVGKSTLARDIAVQYAANNWDVLIADLDDKQTTSLIWHKKRDDLKHQPKVKVTGTNTTDTALGMKGFDLVVFDGKPYSDEQTRNVAKASDLIVIPTGPTLDDLYPQVLLAHELSKYRVDGDRIIFVINSVVSDLDGAEVKSAKEYITLAGYRVADAVLGRRSAYSQAQNMGRSLSEVSHPTLRAQAVAVVTQISSLLKEKVS